MVLVEGLGLLRCDHISVVGPAVMSIFEQRDILGVDARRIVGVAGTSCVAPQF